MKTSIGSFAYDRKNLAGAKNKKYATNRVINPTAKIGQVQTPSSRYQAKQLESTA